MDSEYAVNEDLMIDVNYDEIEENDMLIKNENDLITMELIVTNALKMFDVCMESMIDTKISLLNCLLHQSLLLMNSYVNVSNEMNETLLLDKMELNEIVQIDLKMIFEMT